LTCAATHVAGSQTEGIKRGEDGLSPTLSEWVANEKYVLTCSSYLEGNGVHLQLCENHLVWNAVYKHQHESDENEQIARESMASMIRKSAERNVDEWTKRTEEVYHSG
jgi:hypothetical protein